MVILFLLIIVTGWVVIDEFWYLNETKGTYDDCAD